MNKNYKKAISTFIRNLYGANSCLTFGFFNQNLSFRISQYNNGRNRNNSFSQNDMGDGITATVNYEGASYLYEVARSIVNDTNPENEKSARLERGETTIILEYKRAHNNRMVAYLVIEKNRQSISYEFVTRTCQDKNDGQLITKVVQSELGAFAKTIEGYLIGVGADRHLAKMPDGYENPQDEHQQGFNTTGNSGYQQENYSGYQQGNNNSYGTH